MLGEIQKTGILPSEVEHSRRGMDACEGDGLDDLDDILASKLDHNGGDPGPVQIIEQSSEMAFAHMTVVVPR